MRYELHDEELAVFFTADELNVAVAYENAMHRPRGISSGELLYACIVDSINAGTPLCLGTYAHELEAFVGKPPIDVEAEIRKARRAA